jgi:hypothetical protein
MTNAVYDYGGDFDPSFDHSKLSQDGLVGLLAAYSNYIRKLDGHWYLSVMNKCGNDVAYDCDIDVWNKLMKFELKVASDMMNICGNGVTSVAKYFQVSPWFWTFKPRLELKGDNSLEVTFDKCPTLLALEKEGSGREAQICRGMEPELFETIAHHFNPKMKVAALQLPPRKNVDDICCRWEFRVERER